VKSPKLLDDQRLAEIEKRDAENRQLRQTFAVESSDLRKQVEHLTSPNRSRAQEHDYNTAKTALEQFGELRPPIESVLRHLRTHGTLTFSAGPKPTPQLSGISTRDLKAYLNLCHGRHLVTINHGPNISGGSQPVYDEIYSISPVMADALTELLYPP
jgi:hypothetical protein